MIFTLKRSSRGGETHENARIAVGRMIAICKIDITHLAYATDLIGITGSRGYRKKTKKQKGEQGEEGRKRNRN